MAEAPIKWKVDTLRAIIAAPLHARFAPTPNTEEMAWFIDMEKDGYVEGRWGRAVKTEEFLTNKTLFIPYGGQEVCSELHVTEKGKKFVHDYDAHQQAAEDLKKLDVQQLLKWDDKKLSEWQSHYEPKQAHWILAEQEWKRRAGISTRRIAITAIVVSIISVGIAALSFWHSLNSTTATPVKPLEQPVSKSQ